MVEKEILMCHIEFDNWRQEGCRCSSYMRGSAAQNEGLRIMQPHQQSVQHDGHIDRHPNTQMPTTHSVNVPLPSLVSSHSHNHNSVSQNAGCVVEEQFD